MPLRPRRILHIDGDSFFASCEMALDPKLKKKPLFVGGGRRGNGIVIASNYLAKVYGIKTGMACFEAKHKCPDGVLVPPHYDEYRRLSLEIFRRVRYYTPLLVPSSIDEGYLDFTDSPAVFRCRTPAELVARMKRELAEEVGVPLSMGLGSSRWLAKLATEKCKPNGFLEVKEDEERDFLHDIPVRQLSGIAGRRARSLQALGVWTFGDIAQLPLGLLEKRYGFLGLELWQLSRGEYREPLALVNKPRTCIGSATTLPYDEPDYETALLFLLDQTEKVVTTFFRENLKAREMGLYVRFKDHEGKGANVVFPTAQFEPRLINPQVERLFHEVTAHEEQPIRQVCINFWNLQPLDLEPNLFNDDVEFKRRQLHYALEEVEALYGKRCVKTGTRLLLEEEAEYLVGDKPKCPFMPQREIGIKIGNIPEPMLDLVYEDEWKPLEKEAPAATLPLPRTWGRSTSRTQKFM
jgi:DNA polymerase IV